MLGHMSIASICFVSHRGCDGLIPVIAGRGTPKPNDLQGLDENRPLPLGTNKLERRPEQRVPLVSLESDFAG
jgi:hypothetical protein